MKKHLDVLEALLRAVADCGGTDMLLTAGTEPLVRVDGALRPAAGFAAIDDDTRNASCTLLDDEQHAQLEHDRDLDFAFSHENSRFRGNAFFERGRRALALRLMHSRIPSFDEILLPHAVRDLSRLHQGLVLFTGPTARPTRRAPRRPRCRARGRDA